MKVEIKDIICPNCIYYVFCGEPRYTNCPEYTINKKGGLKT